MVFVGDTLEKSKFHLLYWKSKQTQCQTYTICQSESILDFTIHISRV